MKIITNVYYILLLIIVILPTTMAWAAEEKSNIINNSSSSYLSSSSSISLNNTNVDFATNIEFIKGHYLLQFQINKQEIMNLHRHILFIQYMKYIH